MAAKHDDRLVSVDGCDGPLRWIGKNDFFLVRDVDDDDECAPSLLYIAFRSREVCRGVQILVVNQSVNDVVIAN